MQSDKRAFILDADTVKVSDTETLAQRIDSAQVDFGPINARVDEEITARASADNAIAIDLSTVSAKASQAASVTTAITASVGPGGAYTQATVMLDSAGHITGFSQTNDGTTGEMAIVADKFSIVSPTGSG